MSRKIKIVKIDSNYCDYLRKFNNKVPYNEGIKELRPFIDILFIIGDYEYFVPLSSPKIKHKSLKNTIDLLKINDGIYGVVNFNNMIPVESNNYINYYLSSDNKDKDEIKIINLLRNQLRWLTSNRKEIMNKSRLLYNLYKNDKLPDNVKCRCCNFPLLEDKCDKYIDQNKCSS